MRIGELWQKGKERVMGYVRLGPILLSFLFYKFYQSRNRNVIMQGKGKYELIYTLNNRTYRIKLMRKRGPSKIARIEDSATNEDITSRIQEYMGPNEDFHGCTMTPRMMNYREGLCFIMRDDTVLMFGPNDTLSLPK